MSENLNATKGDWSDLSEENKKTNSSSDFPKAEFINTKNEGTRRVRLVGNFVKFRRHWKPYNKGVRTHENLRDVDPAWQAGFYPSRRFAINVIDRDDGKLKILEAGPKVFEGFSVYKKATGIDPAGPQAPDFAITIEIPKKSDGSLDLINKKYGVVALPEKSPFTDEEKKLICKTDENGEIIRNDNGKPVSNLWPLSLIFKPMSVEGMNELWNAIPEDKKQPPKKKEQNQNNVQSSSQNDQTKEKKQSENEEVKDPIVDSDSDNSDDLFDDSSNDTSQEESTDLF